MIAVWSRELNGERMGKTDLHCPSCDSLQIMPNRTSILRGIDHESHDFSQMQNVVTVV
jgi:hypothetical protein